MTGEQQCSGEERELLDTIKLWPGIEALVKWTPGRGWELRTPESEAERYYREQGI